MYDYVRRQYGVDPVPGHRVRLETYPPSKAGKLGTIARERSPNHYVHVVFDGEKHASPCHPTSLEYLGAPTQPETGSAPR